MQILIYQASIKNTIDKAQFPIINFTHPLIKHPKKKVNFSFISELFHHTRYVALGRPSQFVVNMWIQAWHIGRKSRDTNMLLHSQLSVHFDAPINV